MSPADAQCLLRLSPAQLDALFAAADSGPIPEGRADGTALIAPGTPLGRPIATLVNLFAWKGKTFDGRHRTLTNRISPLGISSIKAVVYEEGSWFDDRPCIVLDYSKTSLVARFIRDEIRPIGPGLYLGKVYLGKRPAFGFALQF